MANWTGFWLKKDYDTVVLLEDILYVKVTENRAHMCYHSIA